MTIGKATFAIACVGALGACGGTGPHTPASMRGTVHVTVVNGTTEPVCEFEMEPASGTTNSGNWLGKGKAMLKLAPGQSVDFDVAPSTYVAGAAGCEYPKSFGLLEGLAVQQPTYVSIGRQAGTPPPSTNAVTVPVVRLSSPEEVQSYVAALRATHPQSNASDGAGGACVSGACDPNGPPCCGGIACSPDAAMGAGHYYCGSHR